MSDVIDLLAGIAPGSPVDTIRRARPDARDNSQASFLALLEPAAPGTFSLAERYAVSTFVALLHADGEHDLAADFYEELLRDAVTDDEAAAVLDAARTTRAPGPYGTYREPGLAAESVPGPTIHLDDDRLAPRLRAALDHAHLLVLHPRDARPEVLRRLADAGWDPDGIVSLSQLVAFLTYQLRQIHGLRRLVVATGAEREATASPVRGTAGAASADSRATDASGAGAAAIVGPSSSGTAGADSATESPAPSTLGTATPAAEETRTVHPASSATILEHPDLQRPEAFTQVALGWVPWVEPVPEDQLTDVQRAGLIEAARAASPYFRLLARDPEALRARTLTDLDIFTNEAGGVPRADRELSAAATSRVNGCVFCASVHARAASRLSGRRDDVQSLLDQGIGAELGERWDAVVAASAALAQTPPAFGTEHIEALRSVGIDDQGVADVIAGAAFFHWANRLMLSLGEPEAPTPKPASVG